MASELTSTTSSNVHLLVLIHGMWGNPIHLSEMERIYREVRGPSSAEEGEKGPAGEELAIIVPETNRDSATYDGIDWGGERVAEEVLAEVKRLEAQGKKVTRFSITGYSLGGLIARYVVGILYQKEFFQDVTPVNFNTVATPHLGQIRYKSLRSKLFAFLGPKMLSRTGEQLYTIDNWAESGRPLLDILAEPGRVFYRALSTFSTVRFYANSVNDITVPYMTAAVEAADPFLDHTFNGIKIEIDEKYAPIICSFEPPTAPKPRPPAPRILSKKWFKNFRPPLPPALQFKFPGNVLVIMLLPILFPAFFSLAMVRLSLDSRKSRSRLRLLEKDESYRERLIHIVGRLERTIEDAAIEYMDDPGSVQGSSQTLLQATEQSSSTSPASSPGPEAHIELYSDVLSPLQHRIVQAINQLPNMKKVLVFIDPVINSHAVIIARDVKRFKHHELGQGVLRHLADHFVM